MEVQTKNWWISQESTESLSEYAEIKKGNCV